MEELRVYMVNTESIYDAIQKIVSDIVKSESKKILRSHIRRTERIAYESVLMYRSEVGALGRIGCRQYHAVGQEILKDEVDEAFLYYKRHGEFSKHLMGN